MYGAAPRRANAATDPGPPGYAAPEAPADPGPQHRPSEGPVPARGGRLGRFPAFPGPQGGRVGGLGVKSTRPASRSLLLVIVVSSCSPTRCYWRCFAGITVSGRQGRLKVLALKEVAALEDFDSVSTRTRHGEVRKSPVVQKRLVGALAATLMALAAVSLGAGTTASASQMSASALTGASNQRCPDEVWSGGDTACRISYTGSRWYNGDWVAVHWRSEGQAWVNGYTPKNVDYRVAIQDDYDTIWSNWARGGTGTGLSVGTSTSRSIAVGFLVYASGTTLRVE